MRDEVLRDQVVPMALRWILFAAQDSRSLFVGQFQQALTAFDKPVTLHHFGIIYFVQVVCAFAGQGASFVTARIGRAAARNLPAWAY